MRTLLLAGRIAVVLVLVASTQSVLVVRAAFELDRESIAERLCINRDRPELDCHGTCQLSRMLREQQDRDDRRTQATLEIALSVTPLVASAVPVPPPSAMDAPAHRRPASGRDTGVEAALSVFHPPRLVRAA